MHADQDRDALVRMVQVRYTIPGQRPLVSVTNFHRRVTVVTPSQVISKSLVHFCVSQVHDHTFCVAAWDGTKTTTQKNL